MIIKDNLDLVESSIKWLAEDLVPASEIIPKLSFNYFWSNPSGEFPIEKVIYVIINRNGINDILFLIYAFGSEKVKEVYLKYFKPEDRALIWVMINV